MTALSSPSHLAVVVEASYSYNTGVYVQPKEYILYRSVRTVKRGKPARKESTDGAPVMQATMSSTSSSN